MKIRSCARKVVPALAVSLVSLFLSSATAAELQTLERGLVEQAPALIKHFKEKSYHNVGVLKFLISRGGEKLSDNAGTMNMLLARRLEVALVLANTPRDPVGIIRNASAVAARTGGHHLAAGKRKLLFEPDYPLAWGNKKVKADAFVTGIAAISKDLRTLQVSLFAFDKDNNKLAQVGEDFKVRNDAGKLAEMNESFVLRGLFDDGQAVKTAAKIKEKEVKHPLAERTQPVSLEIRYGDKVVGIEYRDGKAFIPEPSEKQKVSFRLRRDGGKDRYGVVLKINGENSIAKQRLPDLQCRRWILAARAKPITISGYQLDAKTAQKFRVLSRAESKARAIDYGEDVGTISMTVFREQKKDETADPTESTEERNSQVVAKVRLPADKESYNALKASLLEGANENETRGLIGEGEKLDSRVKIVKFKPEPTPLMSITIVYYKPGEK